MYHFCLAPFLIIAVLLSIATPINAFSATSSASASPTIKSLLKIPTPHNFGTHLFQLPSDENEENKVAIGSSEYYQGFVGRSLNEEPAERVTGDAILGPTFKFVGGFAAILVVLTFGFLVSNGLI